MTSNNIHNTSTTQKFYQLVLEAPLPERQSHSTTNYSDTSNDYPCRLNPSDFISNRSGPHSKLPVVSNASSSMTAGQVPSTSSGALNQQIPLQDSANTSELEQVQLDLTEAANTPKAHSIRVKDLVSKIRKPNNDSKITIPQPPPPPPIHAAAKPATRCHEQWSAKVS